MEVFEANRSACGKVLNQITGIWCGTHLIDRFYKYKYKINILKPVDFFQASIAVNSPWLFYYFLSLVISLGLMWKCLPNFYHHYKCVNLTCILQALICRNISVYFNWLICVYKCPVEMLNQRVVSGGSSFYLSVLTFTFFITWRNP